MQKDYLYRILVICVVVLTVISSMTFILLMQNMLCRG